MRKSKNLLPRNQVNVSKWGDMYSRVLLFLTMRVGLLQNKQYHHRKVTLYSCK